LVGLFGRGFDPLQDP